MNSDLGLGWRRYRHVPAIPQNWLSPPYISIFAREEDPKADPRVWELNVEDVAEGPKSRPCPHLGKCRPLRVSKTGQFKQPKAWYSVTRQATARTVCLSKDLYPL
jgi:hypothetical protein